MATYMIGQTVSFPWTKRAFKGAEAFDDSGYDGHRSFMRSDFLGKLFNVENQEQSLRVKIEHIYVSNKFYIARVVSLSDPFARAYVRIGMRDAEAKILKVSC